MQPFEIILLLLPIPYLIWPFFARTRPRWLQWLPLAAVAILLIHLVVEGYRWQMIPAYLLTGLLAIQAIWNLSRPRSPHRPLQIIGGMLGLIWLAIAALLPWALPVPKLLDTTGPYAVGTRSFELVDPARMEPYNDSAETNRRIMAQIWYPTDQTAGLEEALYLADFDILAPLIAQSLGFPDFFLNHIANTHTNIWIDAPLVETTTPAPVLVFSHGLGGFRSQNSSQLRDLASHGYIIIAADHTYGSVASVFPDGEVVLKSDDLLDEQGDPPHTSNLLVNTWTGDIDLLLDTLESWNNDPTHWLSNRLDLGRIGLFGHSTGGGSAFNFCAADSRCSAIVGLDPWVTPMADETVANGWSQPLLIMKAPEWTTQDDGRNNQRIANIAASNLPSYLLTINGTAHADFSDQGLLSPITGKIGLSGPIDSAYSVGLQTSYLLAFFDQTLRDIPSELLANPSPYPEVDYEPRP